MIRLFLSRCGFGVALIPILIAFGPSKARAADDDAIPNIVASVTKAPVTPDGTVSGRPTELVINLDTSLDPNVNGRTLLAGRTIKVTLPDAFESDGRLIQQSPCEVLKACNSVALLQGWPQNPIPFPKYALSYEGTNTIVITALADLGPVSTQNPGIKQLHLIMQGFTNPKPGNYAITVSSETGQAGALETGVGHVHIIPRSRPNLNVVSATPDNPPPRANKIYQTTHPGMLTRLPLDFLVWDRNTSPFLGIEVVAPGAEFRPEDADRDFDDGDFLLVKDHKIVGHVTIDAPPGSVGETIFTVIPSSAFVAPVTGIPSALLRVFFRAGSATGEYAVNFKLNGGNSAQMFIRVD